jgi:peroxiredoxin
MPAEQGWIPVVVEHRVCHELLSDPEIRLARALELPMFTDQGVECYRRLTIVAFAGRVAKVFFPVQSPQASAAQVFSWLALEGR